MVDTPAEDDGLNLAAPLGDDAIALSLDDLLPDANGNVVLFNDAGVTEMSIIAERPVIDSGIAGEGAGTSCGADVAGMAYYSFDPGPTLYYPMNLHVSIISDTI
jgi:hypothetical protein